MQLLCHFKGEILAQGTYEEISSSNLDIKQLLHIEKDEEKAEERRKSTKLDRQNSTLSTAVSKQLMKI